MVFQTSLHHLDMPDSNTDSLSARPVVIGFNNTTRALEQQAKAPESSADPIELLLVCKDDIVSELASAHFPGLCAVARVARLVGLPRGSAQSLSLAYNGPEPDTTNLPSLQKRKVGDDEEKNKSKKDNKEDSIDKTSDFRKTKFKHRRRPEVTVVGVRKSARVKYPLLGSLSDMLADRGVGAVTVPEIVAQMDREKVRYKSTQIATVKTTAPILGKKQQQQAQKQDKSTKNKERQQQQQQQSQKQDKSSNNNEKQEPPKKKQKITS